MDKKDNPMSRLMELAAPYKGEYVLSVILAILGVAAGLLPFLQFQNCDSLDGWRDICGRLYGVVSDCGNWFPWKSMLCKFIYFSFPYGHFRNSGGNPPETSR